MKKYTYTKNGFTFERIDKKQARRAYNNGLTVIFLSLQFALRFPIST